MKKAEVSPEVRKPVALAASMCALTAGLTPIAVIAGKHSLVQQYVVLGVQAMLLVIALTLATRAIARKRAEQQ